MRAVQMTATATEALIRKCLIDLFGNDQAGIKKQSLRVVFVQVRTGMLWCQKKLHLAFIWSI